FAMRGQLHAAAEVPPREMDVTNLRNRQVKDPTAIGGERQAPIGVFQNPGNADRDTLQQPCWCPECFRRRHAVSSNRGQWTITPPTADRGGSPARVGGGHRGCEQPTASCGPGSGAVAAGDQDLAVLEQGGGRKLSCHTARTTDRLELSGCGVEYLGSLSPAHNCNSTIAQQL